MNYKNDRIRKNQYFRKIDVDKTNKSKECNLCHYWYFLHKNFSFGPYICDDCSNFSQKSRDFKNITIVHINKNTYRIYFLCMSKREAKKLIKKFDLIDKTGSITCNDYNNNNNNNNNNSEN